MSCFLLLLLRYGGHAVPCGTDDDVTGSRGVVSRLFSYLPTSLFFFFVSKFVFYFTTFFSLFLVIIIVIWPKFYILVQIHKVIGGSVADRDGRIQKGDRVLSINGKGLKGVTHREALAILKVLLKHHCLFKST